MKDELEKYIREHKSSFEVPPLSEDHEIRFIQKLRNHSTTQRRKATVFKLRRGLAVAASISLIIVCGVLFLRSQLNRETMANHVQLDKARQHFGTLVSYELKELEQYKGSDYQTLVFDVMQSFKKLENDHQQLLKDLERTNGSPRVLQALINNYQQKISLLQDVQEQILQLKNTTHEKPSSM